LTGRALLAVLLLSLAGSTAKIAGGLFYGSRALLVDALTSFANIVAAVATIYYYKLSRVPPDADHPFGHYRLGYVGVLVTMVAYGYVAGIASAELAYSREYTVEIEAVYSAVAGFILYGLAVLLSLRIGGFMKAYGFFTVSELYESAVTIAAATAGALYTYLVDYAGAVGLTAYIVYELVHVGRETIHSITDKSAPPSLLSEVRELIEKSGYRVTSLRVRYIDPGTYHGDARIAPATPQPKPVDEVKRALREKYGLDIALETTS